MLIDDCVKVVEEYCAASGGVLVRSVFQVVEPVSGKQDRRGVSLVRLVCEINFTRPGALSFQQRGALCRALGLERSEGSAVSSEGVTVLADVPTPKFR